MHLSRFTCRNLPRQGNPYYNQRVKEQGAGNNPVLSQRIVHLQPLSWQDHVGSMLAMVLGLCIGVCCFILFWLVFMEVTVFVAEQVIEPFFSLFLILPDFSYWNLFLWAHLIILVISVTQLLEHVWWFNFDGYQIHLGMNNPNNWR